MRHQRVTREESRARTRARLLEAAAGVFAERGFYGASVEEIAARAGYTRGAFYANFADKEGVFLAVMDQRDARQIAEISGLVKASGSPEELFQALRDFQTAQPRDPTWISLATEFRLHALRHPAVRPKLAERERILRRAYGQAVVAQLHALGIPLPAPLEHLGILVEALDHETAVQHHIDPEGVPDGLFVDVLALLLSAVGALSAQPEPRPG